MDPLNVEIDGDKIRFLDFPDATKIVALHGSKAQMLADLSLHLTDLIIAREALMALNTTTNQYARDAMWRSAIIHYIKCFSGDHKARFKVLNINYITNDEVIRKAHWYFDSLRNNHIVHDANDYLNSFPMAVLNDGGKSSRIEKVVAFAAGAVTLYEENFNNLLNLTVMATSWLDSAMNGVCASIKADLEALPSDELDAMPKADFNTPALNNIGETRRTVRKPKSGKGSKPFAV